MIRQFKVVVVGDGAVGKTCLLSTFSKNYFPEEYVPTVFDNTDVVIEADDGHPVKLALWDTAGQEDYDRLRPLSYPKTDVVLICFSVADISSFENVSRKWAPEIRHHCSKYAMWLLVGTKCDLRDQAELCVRSVPRNTAEQLGAKLGAAKYMECSAKTRQGVRYLFEWVARLVLQRGSERLSSTMSSAHRTNSHCNVM